MTRLNFERVAIVLLLLATVLAAMMTIQGCATVQQWISDGNGTIQQYAAYYESFSAGVKAALPVLTAICAAAAPYVSVVSASLVLLDAGVADLRNLASSAALASEAVQAKLSEIQSLIQNINAAVGAIRASTAGAAG